MQAPIDEIFKLFEGIQAKVPNGISEIIQNLQLYLKGEHVGSIRLAHNGAYRSSFKIPQNQEVADKLTQLFARNGSTIFFKWNQALIGDFAAKYCILDEEGNPITIDIKDLPLEFVIPDDKLSFSENFGITYDQAHDAGYENFGITYDQAYDAGYESKSRFDSASHLVPATKSNLSYILSHLYGYRRVLTTGEMETIARLCQKNEPTAYPFP